MDVSAFEPPFEVVQYLAWLGYRSDQAHGSLPMHKNQMAGEIGGKPQS
jgi:hypothetical protein